MKKHSAQHLRLFVLSLGVILVALIGVLFGVHMEAVAHVTGTVEVRGAVELRTESAGLVEVGWYEGEIPCAGELLRVRLDRHGNGMSDPAQGVSHTIEHCRCREAASLLTPEQLRFHKLESGDRLWPGQIVGRVRGDDLLVQLQRLLGQGALLAPKENEGWEVLKVCCSQGQAVKPGDVLAVLAPVNGAKNQPRGWIAKVEISEKQFAGVQPGQEVRLCSAMYNPRLHGHADGVVEKIEPCAEPGPHGERHFLAQVRIVSAPFTLYHGSSVKGEIVLDHKRVYRIILEQ